MKIAIDGPSGVGKSTLAKAIAEKFNLIYIDTGAMYRMVGLYFCENKLSIDSLSDIKKHLDYINIKLVLEDGVKLLLNNRYVEHLIRTHEIARVSSILAQLAPVRNKLNDLQKNIARNYEVVMDGRDVAINIIPDADIKIYLNASTKIRAQRRLLDLGLSQEKFDVIYKKISDRDEKDFNRKLSPLRVADDAIVINTDNMSFDEVKKKVFDLISKSIIKKKIYRTAQS